jgi:hypothetical protein
VFPPRGRPAWSIALLGAAGSASLFLQNPDHVAASYWAATLALAVPASATLVTPRRFAGALLAGWVGGGAALYVYSFLVVDGTYAVFGLTLLALLVLAVPFTGATPLPPTGHAAQR